MKNKEDAIDACPVNPKLPSFESQASMKPSTTPSILKGTKSKTGSAVNGQCLSATGRSVIRLTNHLAQPYCIVALRFEIIFE